MLSGGWAEFYSFEDGVVTILDIFLCTAKVILDLFRKFRKKSVNKRRKNQNSPVIPPAELPLGCIILKHIIMQYICTQLYKWDCANLEPVFSFYFKTRFKIIFHSTECSVLYSFTRWSVRCGHKRGHRGVQVSQGKRSGGNERGLWEETCGQPPPGGEHEMCLHSSRACGGMQAPLHISSLAGCTLQKQCLWVGHILPVQITFCKKIK